jgi:hypothetical protein
MILPGFQRRGIGSHVLSIEVANANALGKPLRLHTSRANDAREFYRRHGFSEIGRDGDFIDFERAVREFAPRVVDEREQIELFVTGDAPGRLQLVVINRIQPVFVTTYPAPPLPPDAPPRPPPAMDLVRERRESGPDRLVARLADPGAWFREIATRYPGDVVFLVLEARPDAARSPGTELAVTTSNVLPVRLTRGAGARH